MNYTNLKIGFTLTMAIMGIIFTHNAYTAMNNIMTAQADKMSAVYNIK